MHKVLVVSDGINFRAFYKNKRLKKTPLSDSRYPNGNPYAIYGAILSEWLKIDKFDMEITVAEITSGNL